jgi:radical SAM superfamily enzyme YgiQ (UPF0313 family)
VKVLLVSANREHIPDPIFPLGLAYVATATRQAGHQVEVADLCFGRRPLATLAKRIAAFRPEVVGVSMRNVDNAAYPLTVDYLPRHREVVDTIRRCTRAPVVVGGSGFSILPLPYMSVLAADFGIAGAGEQSFVALLAALCGQGNPRNIPGVLVGSGGNHRLPGLGASTSERLTDPALYASASRPARELFDYARYIRRGGCGNIQTKRGCVFKCSYCTYPLLEGRRFQSRPAADVVDEIEALQVRYGPHPMFFVDSILNFPRGHVEQLCEEILRRRLRLRWSCYATPLKLDRHQATLMAAAGCEGIELGTDAVDDGQLRRLGKSFDADTVRQANAHCLAAGLRVCHTLIFGGRGETPDSVRNTCRAIRAMQPTAVVAMTGVRVYPDTPFAQQLIAAGEVQHADIGLAPTFYVAPQVVDFLPGYLTAQAREAGNWVLPGMQPPLLPTSQRLLRGLGVSGPLWRLLRHPWMRRFSRNKFRRADTSWGIPHSSETRL